jgi:hypothetical protein
LLGFSPTGGVTDKYLKYVMKERNRKGKYNKNSNNSGNGSGVAPLS